MVKDDDDMCADDSEGPRRYIFVDANVLIPMFSGKNPSGLDALHALSIVSRAQLLTTDITRIETAKHLAEADCDLLKPVENDRFRERVNELLNSVLPSPDFRDLYLKAYERHKSEVQCKTSGNRWQCLDVSDTNLLNLFSQYGEKRGLFSDNAKKSQFADAIVFEKLINTGTPTVLVYIFSQDKDFIEACQSTQVVKLERSWSELLQALGVDQDVDEIKGMIEAYKTEIIKEVSDTIDSRFRSRLPSWVLNSSNYITHVEVKPSRSFRDKRRIVLSGSVHVTYQFPCMLPAPFGFMCEEVGTIEALDGANTREGFEYCFEANFLANLLLYENPQGSVLLVAASWLEGVLLLEIASLGHDVGYRIMPLMWRMTPESPVESRDRCSPGLLNPRPRGS